ncbi:MAG: UpxY family transcription antiterminator [Rikenellaceae bacterium]
MIDYTNPTTVWYAMKTTYKRELKAKALLDAHQVENFIPMQRHIVVKNGKKQLVCKPAINNLIFMRANGDVLQKMKSKADFIHNRLMKDGNSLIPIIIPDGDMNQFITLTNNSLDKIQYLDLSSVVLSKGGRVRVIGGDFMGYEGVLMKIKGARDKRVVVSIEGVIAVAMATIDAELIEKI